MKASIVLDEASMKEDDLLIDAASEQQRLAAFQVIILVCNDNVVSEPH